MIVKVGFHMPRAVFYQNALHWGRNKIDEQLMIGGHILYWLPLSKPKDAIISTVVPLYTNLSATEL